MKRTLALCLALIGLVLSPSVSAQGQRIQPFAQKVVLVTLDGVRWQEVFHGADENLLPREAGAPEAEAYRARFGDTDPHVRRRLLMPFLWTTIAEQGQLWGDHKKHPGSATATNRRNFSYPGYSELLVGFADDRIISNKKIPNPNVSVLEWLELTKDMKGKTASFASWDVFPSILNQERSGTYVNAGWQTYQHPEGENDLVTLRMNALQHGSYQEWPGVRFDTFTFNFALDYLERYEPTVLYLALGEPDDWSHAGRYGHYLDAIHRNDSMLETLWTTLQANPAYQGKTTLILTVDHGRGRTPLDWTKHGGEVPGSDEVWMALIGTGIEARGQRNDLEGTQLAQIASSVAAALGLNFQSLDPRIAPPLPQLNLSPTEPLVKPTVEEERNR